MTFFIYRHYYNPFYRWRGSWGNVYISNISTCLLQLAQFLFLHPIPIKVTILPLYITTFFIHLYTYASWVLWILWSSCFSSLVSHCLLRKLQTLSHIFRIFHHVADDYLPALIVEHQIWEGEEGGNRPRKKSPSFPEFLHFHLLHEREEKLKAPSFCYCCFLSCFCSYCISPLTSICLPKGIFQKRKNDYWWS